MNSVTAQIDQASAIVGLAAVHLESGASLKHNADQIFFTASTFKVPLLVELYKQVDAGTIDLSQRIKLTEAMHSAGSGVLKEMGSGLSPTVHNLAMLMTIISDNTATDILYNLVGQDNLHATMNNLGLTSIKIPMNTRQLLFNIVGLDAGNPDHSYETAVERLTLNELDLESDGFSEERSDVSSPEDMSKLLEMLYRGEILSKSSRDGALDILMRQQHNARIPLLLPIGTIVAHKTGTYHGICCDVGIVFSPSGPYTISIMTKCGTESGPKAELELAAISKAVYDEFNP